MLEVTLQRNILNLTDVVNEICLVSDKDNESFIFQVYFTHADTSHRMIDADIHLCIILQYTQFQTTKSNILFYSNCIN